MDKAYADTVRLLLAAAPDVFANALWKQGRAKPNAQAALLIHLVKRFPDTVERLAAI
jgi:DNA-binding transcriptional regulator YiaG